MLKRCLAVTALIMFMVGFTAADILGRQRMAAETRPSADESAKKADAFLSQWDKNDMHLSFTRDDKGKIAGFVFNSAADGREVKGIAFERRQ